MESVGKDGKLIGIGNDIDSKFQNVHIGGSLMVNGGILDFSGGNKNTIFTIKSNRSDSFVVQTGEKKKVLIFDTTHGNEFVHINSSLTVSGSLINFTAPRTAFIIPNGHRSAYSIRRNSAQSNNSSIVRIDTDSPLSKVEVNANFVINGGFQSYAQNLSANAVGAQVPTYADVLRIRSANSNFQILLPPDCKEGHHITFLSYEAYQITFLNVTGTKINSQIPPLIVPIGTRIVDCTYLGGLEWVCLRINRHGRTHSKDEINVKQHLIFHADSNEHEHTLMLGAEVPTASNTILLPDVSGKVITTGNLFDINGTVNSIIVKNNFAVHGNVTLGDSDEDTIRIRGRIAGEDALVFRGGSSVSSNKSHATVIRVDEPTQNNTLILPAVSGTILTTGNLKDINGTIKSLSVSQKLVVAGETTLGQIFDGSNNTENGTTWFPSRTIVHGEFAALNDVVLGKDNTSKISLNGIIRYKDPLRFSKDASGNSYTTFLVNEIQRNQTLVLPNVDGTIITTGNQQDITIEKASLIVVGNTSFLTNGAVQLGDSKADVITLGGVLHQGEDGSYLNFRGQHGNTISFHLLSSVSMHNSSIVVPGVGGKIITDQNLDLITHTGVLDSTTVDGSLDVLGQVRIAGKDSQVNISGTLKTEGDILVSNSGGQAVNIIASGLNSSVPAMEVSFNDTLSHLNTLMKLAAPKASRGTILNINAQNLQYGTGIHIDASNLFAGSAFEVIGGSEMTQGSLFKINAKSTGGVSPMEIHAGHVEGGAIMNIRSNAISSGSSLKLEVTGNQADAVSQEGKLLLLELNGTRIGQGIHVSAPNMVYGTLVDISAQDQLDSGKLLSVSTTSAYAINPILFEANSMKYGDVLKISAESLVHGSALELTSGNGNNLRCESNTCGAMLKIDGRHQTNGVMMLINAPDMVDGAAVKINGGSKNNVLIDIQTTTTNAPGGIINIDASNVRQGKIINIETSALSQGSAVSVKHTGYDQLGESGNMVLIDGQGARSGNLLDISAPDLSNGTAVLIRGGSELDGAGKLLEIKSRAENSDAVVDISTSTLLSGSLVSLHGTELKETEASVLKITAGLVEKGTILDVSTGDVTNGNALNIEANSLEKGNAVYIKGGRHLTRDGVLLRVEAEGSSSSGVVAFASNNMGGGSVLNIHATEMKSGNVVHILGDMPSNSNYVGTSNLLKLEATGGVSTGTMLNIHGKDLTNGTALNIFAGDLNKGSALRVVSGGNDANTDHPVVSMEAHGLQGGSVLSIVSNSASTKNRAVTEIRNDNPNAENTQVLRLVHASTDSHPNSIRPAAALAIETSSPEAIFTHVKSNDKLRGAEMTFIRSRVSATNTIDPAVGGDMIGNIAFDALVNTSSRKHIASIKSYLTQPSGSAFQSSVRSGGSIVFSALSPKTNNLSHIMTLSNANEIFLGDGAIDDDFVIGRPDASPSNAEYPHGEGSATVIKGQDAMLGHGGNITLKGGNAHGTSEHGGSVVLQPGKGANGHKSGSVIFQDGWGIERLHIDPERLVINTPEIDLSTQPKTIYLANEQQNALKFVTGDDETMLNFDTKNKTITIHGTLDVHGSIREDPCEIEISNNVDTKLYEVCGQKNTVVVTKATTNTSLQNKIPTLLLPDFDSQRIHSGYRVTIISGATTSEAVSTFQLKVDSNNYYVLNGQLRSSVQIPSTVALVDCITTSALRHQWVCERRTDDGQVVSTGSSPGLFSSVTVESELILKGHGISSESSDVNIILRDNQESALRFAGKPRKILEITKGFPCYVTIEASLERNFVEGDYVYIYGISDMSQLNQKTFKVSGVNSSTIELEDANTTNFKQFEDDETARLVRVITSFDTRKQQESIRMYNNLDVSGALDLRKGIVFSGDDSSLKFNSNASINLLNNARKALDFSWKTKRIDITPSLSTAAATILTTNDAHRLSNGDAIMVTNVVYGSNPGSSINGREIIVKVLSSQQFELPSFPSSVEGVAGMLGHIDNTIVQHIDGITSANPAKIKTKFPHGLTSGTRIIIVDVIGMTELNHNMYAIERIDKYHFNLKQYLDVSLDESSTEFTTYKAGGRIIKIPQSNSLYNFTKLQKVGDDIQVTFRNTVHIVVGDVLTIFYLANNRRNKNGYRFVVKSISDNKIFTLIGPNTDQDICPSASISACDGSVFKISDRVLSLVNGVQAVKTSETQLQVFAYQHGLALNDSLVANGILGNSELNGGTFIVKHVQDPNTITLENYNIKISSNHYYGKGFMYKLTPNHCYSIRKVSQGYISTNDASQNILIELSDITNTKFPVSEGDEIILSDVMQNADVGHRVTMSFSFATQTIGLNAYDTIIVSIPAEIIYFDDINPSIHDDASSCFGNRWNMNILATRSGPTGRLNVEHITIINFTTIRITFDGNISASALQLNQFIFNKGNASENPSFADINGINLYLIVNNITEGNNILSLEYARSSTTTGKFIAHRDFPDIVLFDFAKKLIINNRDKTPPLLKSAKFINASSLLLIFTENVAAASCLASQFSLQNYSGVHIEVETCTVAQNFAKLRVSTVLNGQTLILRYGRTTDIVGQYIQDLAGEPNALANFSHRNVTNVESEYELKDLDPPKITNISVFCALTSCTLTFDADSDGKVWCQAVEFGSPAPTPTMIKTQNGIKMQGMPNSQGTEMLAGTGQSCTIYNLNFGTLCEIYLYAEDRLGNAFNRSQIVETRQPVTFSGPVTFAIKFTALNQVQVGKDCKFSVVGFKTNKPVKENTSKIEIRSNVSRSNNNSSLVKIESYASDSIGASLLENSIHLNTTATGNPVLLQYTFGLSKTLLKNTSIALKLPEFSILQTSHLKNNFSLCNGVRFSLRSWKVEGNILILEIYNNMTLPAYQVCSVFVSGLLTPLKNQPQNYNERKVSIYTVNKKSETIAFITMEQSIPFSPAIGIIFSQATRLTVRRPGVNTLTRVLIDFSLNVEVSNGAVLQLKLPGFSQSDRSLRFDHNNTHCQGIQWFPSWSVPHSTMNLTIVSSGLSLPRNSNCKIAIQGFVTPTIAQKENYSDRKISLLSPLYQSENSSTSIPLSSAIGASFVTSTLLIREQELNVASTVDFLFKSSENVGSKDVLILKLMGFSPQNGIAISFNEEYSDCANTSWIPTWNPLKETLHVVLNSTVLTARSSCRLRFNGFMTPQGVQFVNSKHRTAELQSFVTAYTVPETIIQYSSGVGFALIKATIQFSGSYLNKLNGIPYTIKSVKDSNTLELTNTGKIDAVHDNIAIDGSVGNFSTKNLFERFIQKNRGCIAPASTSIIDVDTQTNSKSVNIHSDMHIAGKINVAGNVSFGQQQRFSPTQTVSINFEQNQALQILNNAKNSFVVRTDNGTKMLSIDTLRGDESISINTDLDVFGSTSVFGDLTLLGNCTLNGGYIDFSMATQGTQIKLKENHIDALKIEAINAPDLMRFDTLNKRVLVNGHVDVNGSLSYTPNHARFDNDVDYIPPGASEIIVDSRNRSNTLFLPLLGPSTQAQIVYIDTINKDLTLKYTDASFKINDIVGISGEECRSNLKGAFYKVKAFQNYENSQFVNVSLKMLNDDNITAPFVVQKNIDISKCHLERSVVSRAGHIISIMADESHASFAGYMLVPQGYNKINMYGTLLGGGIYIDKGVPLVECKSIDATENWVCTTKNRHGDYVLSRESSMVFKNLKATGNVTFTGASFDFSASDASNIIQLHRNGIVFDGGVANSPVTSGTLLNISANELNTGNALDINLNNLTYGNGLTVLNDPGDGLLRFEFIPQNRIIMGEVVNISASATFPIFKPGTVTCSSKVSSIATVPVVTASSSRTLLIAFDIDIAPGHRVFLECSTNLVTDDSAEGLVRFSISSNFSSLMHNMDGYHVYPKNSNRVEWVAASRLRSYVANETQGALKVKFIPGKSIISGGFIDISGSHDIFSAEDKFKNCTLRTNNDAVTIVRYERNTSYIKVYVGDVVPWGQLVQLVCPSNYSAANVNEVTFSISTSSDTIRLKGNKGYEVVAEQRVEWLGAERDGVYIGGMMGNNLLFSFIPKTTMNINDVVDLTASIPLFATQPNITYCRGLHENIYFNSITEIISETRIIITMKEIVYAGEIVKFECSKGLQANPKFSTKVMFTIKTSADTVQVEDQEGYLVSSPKSVSVKSIVLSNSYVLEQNLGTLMITFVPTHSLPKMGHITIRTDISHFQYVNNTRAFTSHDGNVLSYFNASILSYSEKNITLRVNKVLESGLSTTIQLKMNTSNWFSEACNVSYSIKTTSDPVFTNDFFGYEILSASQHWKWIRASRTKWDTLTTGKLLHVMTTSKYATNPILFEANSLMNGVVAKISADSLTSGTALQISSLGTSMKSNGSILKVDANAQKLGKIVDVQANSLEGGTALHVTSSSPNVGSRSSLVTVEGLNNNVTALQIMRLVQYGNSSNNPYYQPASPLVIETNMDESIYIRASSSASESRGATIVLSRDRNGTDPTGKPIANRHNDTVGTISFDAYTPNDRVPVASMFSKADIDENGAVSGSFYIYTKQKNSTLGLKKRLKLDNNAKMELGDDDPFTITRPRRPDGDGQPLFIVGQHAANGMGGWVKLQPGKHTRTGTPGRVVIGDADENPLLSVYQDQYDSSLSATFTITSTSAVLSSSKELDLTRGMLRLSQSQKAAVVEGVGKDIDIGMFDLSVGNIVLNDLKSNSGGGAITYVDPYGRFGSLDGKIKYDVKANSLNVYTGTSLDISRGMLRLSQSQKASILESAAKNLNMRSQALTLAKVAITKNLEVSGKTSLATHIYASKTISPGAVINPGIDGKSWFKISSSGSILEASDQVEGHIIYITNVDTKSSHTITDRNTLTNINPKSTAQFIYTGSQWSKHIDATTPSSIRSSGGNRRRLQSTTAVPRIVARAPAIEKVYKGVQKIVDDEVSDEFILQRDVILLQRSMTSRMRLPVSNGSGRIIRIYIQRNIQSRNRHIIMCAMHSECSFSGNVNVYNEQAASPVEFLNLFSCNQSEHTCLNISSESGGLAGGFVELRDIAHGTWLVNGNLRISSVVAINPCTILP